MGKRGNEYGHLSKEEYEALEEAQEQEQRRRDRQSQSSGSGNPINNGTFARASEDVLRNRRRVRARKPLAEAIEEGQQQQQQQQLQLQASDGQPGTAATNLNPFANLTAVAQTAVPAVKKIAFSFGNGKDNNNNNNSNSNDTRKPHKYQARRLALDEAFQDQIIRTTALDPVVTTTMMGTNLEPNLLFHYKKYCISQDMNQLDEENVDSVPDNHKDDTPISTTNATVPTNANASSNSNNSNVDNSTTNITTTTSKGATDSTKTNDKKHPLPTTTGNFSFGTSTTTTTAPPSSFSLGAFGTNTKMPTPATQGGGTFSFASLPSNAGTTATATTNNNNNNHTHTSPASFSFSGSSNNNNINNTAATTEANRAVTWTPGFSFSSPVTNTGNNATTTATTTPAGAAEDDEDGPIPANDNAPPALVAKDDGWVDIDSFQPVLVYHLDNPKDRKSGFKKFASGLLRLQRSEEDATVARMVMRDSSNIRVLLNCLIQRGMSFTSSSSSTNNKAKKDIYTIAFGAVNGTDRGYEPHMLKIRKEVHDSLLAKLQELAATAAK